MTVPANISRLTRPTPEVAAAFGVKPSTVRAWVKRGLIAPINGTRPMQFSEAEIQRRLNDLKPLNLY